MPEAKQIFKLPLMWKSSRVLLFYSLLFLLPVLASAQDCTHSISGYIKDVSTGKPISYANIYIKEAHVGDVADDDGFFLIKSLCAAGYHISISHIGCETQEMYLNLKGDTTLTIFLDRSTSYQNTGRIWSSELGICRRVFSMPSKKPGPVWFILL